MPMFPPFQSQCRSLIQTMLMPKQKYLNRISRTQPYNVKGSPHGKKTGTRKDKTTQMLSHTSNYPLKVLLQNIVFHSHPFFPLRIVPLNNVGLAKHVLLCIGRSQNKCNVEITARTQKAKAENAYKGYKVI